LTTGVAVAIIILPMKIRLKLILIVLPLLITPLLLVSLAASLAARNGITRVATGFLQFKADELRNYAETQWKLLQDNQLSGNAEFLAVSKSAVESFARSLVRSDSELILALDASGALVLRTAEVTPAVEELARLAALAASGATGWQQVRIGGEERVGQALRFEPFGWYLLITEERETFYQAVNQIFWQSAFILTLTLAASLALLLVLIRYITQPLGQVVGVMREIITTNDLSKRVALEYRDEIGELGHTFNLMTGELQKANNQIKSYAFRAVIAQKNEEKIRHIFQKYVPADVIEQFFKNPESMLKGRKARLAVLFTDIRDFTAIAEPLPPEEVVESLNDYFGPMVDIIQGRQGIVDKYIGDAIMAFFGAPVEHADDALQAVYAGFDMLEALDAFNARQALHGRPPFRIGIGINYGEVTVGNIGSEKKMDYTVVGDGVNVASRLEGLTKLYRVPFLVSESVRQRVENRVPCRLVDKVAVKGKKESTTVYAPRKQLDKQEEKGWKLYSSGIELYFNREFAKAAGVFAYAQEYLPADPLNQLFLARAQHLENNPPGPDWTGVTIVTEK
jgi:class 3 adenylate cyclase/HAMP domain-containing protein